LQAAAATIEHLRALRMPGRRLRIVQRGQVQTVFALRANLHQAGLRDLRYREVTDTVLAEGGTHALLPAELAAQRLVSQTAKRRLAARHIAAYLRKNECSAVRLPCRSAGPVSAGDAALCAGCQVDHKDAVGRIPAREGELRAVGRERGVQAVSDAAQVRAACVHHVDISARRGLEGNLARQRRLHSRGPRGRGRWPRSGNLCGRGGGLGRRLRAASGICHRDGRRLTEHLHVARSNPGPRARIAVADPQPAAIRRAPLHPQHR